MLLLCVPDRSKECLPILAVSLVKAVLSWCLTYRGRCRALAAAAAVGAPGDPTGVPAGTHMTVHLAAVPAAAAEAVVRRVSESQQVQRAPIVLPCCSQCQGSSAAGAWHSCAQVCAVHADVHLAHGRPGMLHWFWNLSTLNLGFIGIAVRGPCAHTAVGHATHGCWVLSGVI